jgi:CRP-like cAMP-binding protein
MGADHMKILYKEIIYEQFLPRQMVFHLGDIGRKFYFILRGTVSVLVKKDGLATGQEVRHHKLPNTTYLTQLKFSEIVKR